MRAPKPLSSTSVYALGALLMLAGMCLAYATRDGMPDGLTLLSFLLIGAGAFLCIVATS